MDNNEKSRCFNIIFLGIFLAEIIICIVGIFILPIREDWLILLVSIIFISGSYTILEKTLSHLLAFCIVNMAPSILLINNLVCYDVDPLDFEMNLLLSRYKADIAEKFIKYAREIRYNSNYYYYFENEEKIKTEYWKTFIIPNIVASILMIFFNILFIILFIIILKKKYWKVVSPTKIPIPKNLKRPYIIYKIYSLLSYITLCYIVILNYIQFSVITIHNTTTRRSRLPTLFWVSGLISILPFVALKFSLIIIKKESKIGVLLIYGTLVGGFIMNIYVLVFIFIDVLIILLSLSSLINLINTILCHRNFGKNLKFYLNFDPDLEKEYGYLNDDDDNDDNDEEEEKDEKISDKLIQYCRIVFSWLKNIII